MTGRERQDPDERFAGDEHRYDLVTAAQRLRGEAQEPRDGHRQVTLVHEDGITTVLFAFDTGGRLADHAADGLVMIHVISGAIDVVTATNRHAMGSGSLLVLGPGVRHDVTASEASVVLLTVHLRHA
jgi:quercetin dioxygenase-like cupin family protein